MVERQGPWADPAAPPPGWSPTQPWSSARPAAWSPAAAGGSSPAQPAAAGPPPHPSGLFPGQPLRPVYREPHPVATAPVLAGIGSTLLWLALFGSIGRDLASYAWWTLVAAVTAWVVALVLTIFGDRGVATGVAVTAGFGLSVATAFVATRWITTYDWPMW
jgi:hypothetical protein